MSEVRLRPAGPEDAGTLRDIVRAAYARYVERMGREPRPMEQDYDVVVRDLDVTIAEADGAAVGLVALEDDPEEGFTVDNVAVHPDAWGRGVGRTLLLHAEAEARRRGHTSIRLYTHSTMTENLALYTRIGYVEYDRQAVDPGEVVFLRKPL